MNAPLFLATFPIINFKSFFKKMEIQSLKPYFDLKRDALKVTLLLKVKIEFQMRLT